MIDHNLQLYPIELRTGSEIGSGKNTAMDFYTVDEKKTGSVWLKFESTPRFSLWQCTKNPTVFQTPLPAERDKTWRIRVTKSSGIRVLIHCNGVEVLNLLMSDSTCADRDWLEYWSRDVVKIRFPRSGDTATNYYRTYTGTFSIGILHLQNLSLDRT